MRHACAGFRVKRACSFAFLATTFAVCVAVTSMLGCGSQPSSAPVPSQPAETASTPTENQPVWDPIQESTAIDGTKTVTTAIASDGSNSFLQLRKRGRHVEIVFAPFDSSGRVFVGLDGSRVRWRIDKQPLHTERWSSSQDGTALFSSRPYVLLQTLEHAGKGRVLHLEYKPYDYTPRLVGFDLPPTVPMVFRHIADPIVASEERAVASQERVAAIRRQYESCLSDDSKSLADCVKILTEHGYSYPPPWK